MAGMEEMHSPDPVGKGGKAGVVPLPMARVGTVGVGREKAVAGAGGMGLVQGLAVTADQGEELGQLEALEETGDPRVQAEVEVWEGPALTGLVVAAGLVAWGMVEPLVAVEEQVDSGH